MENNQLDNVGVAQDIVENTDRIDAGKVGIGAGIVGVIFGIIMTIKAWKDEIALKKERKKNQLYQGVIRKHQAEIDVLKNDKEREEYKNRLWEEIRSKSEE